ncbi:hypothetical protein [Phenylobacterium sp.]|uniref:hypothetical protein n=1 Tax=Phenylobacterium sp. TaxID=1871053 RepID=UPI002E3361FE|nr:hypothetical protein [Phenylobacterium sp.]HEX2561955.1 hypothetical protein [Phenylobacterium sp.]
MNGLLPRLAVVAGVAVALLAPASQAVLGWGQTASEFADDGNGTLRAAGWAFSIWGVIYAGLAAFALHQLGSRSAWLERVRWPAAGAALGCGLWIIAAGLDTRWATVVVITASAVAAIVAAAHARAASLRDGLKARLFVLWPLSLLAGWLTIATLVNLLTVLTAEGWTTAAARTPAAITGIAIAALIAGAVVLRTGLILYAAPVLWGLAAVAAAAMTDAKPPVAAAAIAAALILSLVAAWRLRTHTDRLEL